RNPGARHADSNREIQSAHSGRVPRLVARQTAYARQGEYPRSQSTGRGRDVITVIQAIVIVSATFCFFLALMDVLAAQGQSAGRESSRSWGLPNRRGRGAAS